LGGGEKGEVGTQKHLLGLDIQKKSTPPQKNILKGFPQIFAPKKALELVLEGPPHKKPSAKLVCLGRFFFFF